MKGKKIENGKNGRHSVSSGKNSNAMLPTGAQ